MSGMHDVPTRTPRAPPAELFDRVKNAVAQSPPGPRATYGARLAMGTCVAMATVLAVTLATTRDFRALPFDRLVIMSSEVALLAIVAVLVATMRGRQGLGASVALLLFVAFASTPFYALATAVTPLQPLATDGST